jgi:hypothetical protein
VIWVAGVGGFELANGPSGKALLTIHPELFLLKIAMRPNCESSFTLERFFAFGELALSSVNRALKTTSLQLCELIS